MFHLPSEELGQLTSELTEWSIPFSMATTFFASYMFEILGRKMTIGLSFLATSLVFFVIPYSAPNYNLLLACRCAIGVTMAAPVSHPLIADYVKRSSRGKAVALNGIGNVVGEVFAMGVLLNMTKSMSYYDAFAVAATFVFVMSIFFLMSIKEPNMDHIRENTLSRHHQLEILFTRRISRDRSISHDVNLSSANKEAKPGLGRP